MLFFAWSLTALFFAALAVSLVLACRNAPDADTGFCICFAIGVACLLSWVPLL